MHARSIGPWRFYLKLAGLALMGWLMLSVVPGIYASYSRLDAAELRLERARQSLAGSWEATPSRTIQALIDELHRAQDEHVLALTELSGRMQWLL